MARLIPVTELIRDHNYDLGETYDIVGRPAYAHGGEKVGTVRDLLTDDSGRTRYFVLDVGSWFTAKEVMVPVGAARIEDDGIYFDQLTKDQVKNMSTYTAGQEYTYDNQVEDVRVLYGADKAHQQSTPGEFVYREDDDTYRTPQRLQQLHLGI